MRAARLIGPNLPWIAWTAAVLWAPGGAFHSIADFPDRNFRLAVLFFAGGVLAVLGILQGVRFSRGPAPRHPGRIAFLWLFSAACLSRSCISIVYTAYYATSMLETRYWDLQDLLALVMGVASLGGAAALARQTEPVTEGGST
jgi:hypothetical protein